MTQPARFTCPRCGRTSHSPDDAREGYCGNCHDWTGNPVTVQVTMRPEVAARLAVLISPDWGQASVGDVIDTLIDHAQQGVYRPGSWERPWLVQAFGDSWLAGLEPDDAPGSLSGDGRVIFDRPRHQR